MTVERETMPRARKSGFPRWGSVALPASVLWGTAVGGGLGLLFGNLIIGSAIGAALGVGIGVALLAAAIVIGSHNV